MRIHSVALLIGACWAGTGSHRGRGAARGHTIDSCRRLHRGTGAPRPGALLRALPAMPWRDPGGRGQGAARSSAPNSRARGTVRRSAALVARIATMPPEKPASLLAGTARRHLGLCSLVQRLAVRDRAAAYRAGRAREDDVPDPAEPVTSFAVERAYCMREFRIGACALVLGGLLGASSATAQPPAAASDRARAMADLRRQPCEPALLGARPDRQGQLQGSADRVAPAHGFSRPAPRHAVFRNAALRERHAVHDGGHAPRGGRARSRHRRNEVDAPRGRRRARHRGRSPRSRSRRGVVVEPGRHRPTHHLRDARAIA